jgi:hypothetical protein
MDNAFFIVAVRRAVVSADGILIFTCRIRFAFAPSLAIERSPPLKRNAVEYIVFQATPHYKNADVLGVFVATGPRELTVSSAASRAD